MEGTVSMLTCWLVSSIVNMSIIWLIINEANITYKHKYLNYL